MSTRAEHFQDLQEERGTAGQAEEATSPLGHAREGEGTLQDEDAASAASIPNRLEVLAAGCIPVPCWGWAAELEGAQGEKIGWQRIQRAAKSLLLRQEIAVSQSPLLCSKTPLSGGGVGRAVVPSPTGPAEPQLKSIWESWKCRSWHLPAARGQCCSVPAWHSPELSSWCLCLAPRAGNHPPLQPLGWLRLFCNSRNWL